MTEAYPKQMKDKKTKAKPQVTAKKDKKFLTSQANYSAIAPPADLVRISAPPEVPFRSN